MARNLSAFAAGLLFGFGLLIAQMTNPAKVLAFLDVFGAWDPSLALVMGAALTVTFVGYRFAFRRTSPAFADRYLLPTKRTIDVPLLAGAVLFGAGWGLVGLCPGPAIAAISFGGGANMIFLAAMMAGFWLTRALQRRLADNGA